MHRHYDLTYLNQVFYGNESMVREIVQLFLHQSPELSRTMTRCVRQSRWQELHPLAHKLKSSVTMLGMEALTPLVLDIERISKFGHDPSALPGLVSKLTLELETITRALDNYLMEACGPVRPRSTQLRRA